MPAEHFDVIIIGAGLSGIGAGYRLQERCPDRTYAILEARSEIGGTWDLFRYPGVRSDSDMFTLGYPFRPWKDVFSKRCKPRRGLRKRPAGRSRLKARVAQRLVTPATSFMDAPDITATTQDMSPPSPVWIGSKGDSFILKIGRGN